MNSLQNDQLPRRLHSWSLERITGLRRNIVVCQWEVERVVGAEKGVEARCPHSPVTIKTPRTKTASQYTFPHQDDHDRLSGSRETPAATPTASTPFCWPGHTRTELLLHPTMVHSLQPIMVHPLHTLNKYPFFFFF